MGLIRIDEKKCTRDGLCVQVCPIGILRLDEKEGPVVRSGFGPYCIGCGHCVAVCPQGAIDNVKSPLARHAELPEQPVLDPGTAFSFLRSRRSIRCYKEDPVPREKVLELLDIARYAPTGHNSQGLSYLVVERPDALARVREIIIEWMRESIASESPLAAQLNMRGIIKAHERGEDRLLRGAPLLIAASAPKQLHPAAVSTYLAMEYVELYATSLGMGTCWAGIAYICSQQYPPFAEYLGIPEGKVIHGMMMVGYPQYAYHRLPARNPLDVAWFGEDGGLK